MDVITYPGWNTVDYVSKSGSWKKDNQAWLKSPQ